MLKISHSNCLSCGACVGVCPVEALDLEHGRDINVDNAKCIDCQICVRACPTGALDVIVNGMSKPLSVTATPE